MKRKKIELNLILTLILAATLLVTASPSWAIGEVAFGLSGGISYNPNNVDSTLDQYNAVIRTALKNNTSAKGDEFGLSYSGVFGFNMRYQFNYFFFRIGCTYNSFLTPNTASYTPAGETVANTIKMKSTQLALPATVALLIPLKKKTYFFLGAGASLYYSFIEISQNHPDKSKTDLDAAALIATPSQGISSNKRDRYGDMFVGYHLLIGAEVPVSERVSISAEWIHQEGISQPISNEGLDITGDTAVILPQSSIDVSGDLILFSVNYYISL